MNLMKKICTLLMMTIQEQNHSTLRDGTLDTTGSHIQKCSIRNTIHCKKLGHRARTFNVSHKWQRIECKAPRWCAPKTLKFHSSSSNLTLKVIKIFHGNHFVPPKRSKQICVLKNKTTKTFPGHRLNLKNLLNKLFKQRSQKFN